MFCPVCNGTIDYCSSWNAGTKTDEWLQCDSCGWESSDPDHMEQFANHAEGRLDQETDWKIDEKPGDTQ